VPFPDSVREDSLVRSHRRCCVCHEFAGRNVNVHHVVQEAAGGPNTLENSIVLCLRCHAEAGHYNPKHPLGTKYSPSELRRHRDQWWEYCRNNPVAMPKVSPEDISALRLNAQGPAQALIKRAKARWNYPDYSITVRLELNESMRLSSAGETRPIDWDEFISYAREGNLFLIGEAGMGKTTILIALAERLLADFDAPLPVFVDAATWGSSGRMLLEYVASFSAFADASLHVDELSRLNEANKLLVIINGWNEISADFKADVRERLQQFLAGSASSKVIVATRTIGDSLGIQNPKKIVVRGFTWEEQQALIRKKLPANQATALLGNLRTNSKLRSVTKNPLVLSGVIELHKSGQKIPDNLFDLLDAIVCTFETEGARAIALKGAPLRNCHRQYLEAIAAAMNEGAATIMSEADARRVALQTSRKLVDGEMIAGPTEPSDVLEVLCNHHLLHRSEDGALRFAHQRFQEFFSACVVLIRLERAIDRDDERQAFQAEILNCPFWEDAIELVGLKLAQRQDGKAGDLLVELSLSADLWYASRLAGMLGISNNGSTASWPKLRDAIEQMHGNTAAEARQYALNCAAATRSSEFAVLLWPLLESDDDQVRLYGYRLAGGLSVRQLGLEAIDRMARWPDGRRQESVLEFAHVPENLDFIQSFARADHFVGVQAAAIMALVYYFATDSAVEAWLKAGDTVKEADHALSAVLDVWRRDNVTLTRELVAVARRSSSDKVRRKVGLALLGAAEEIGIEAARRELQEQAHESASTATLVAYLRAVDPGFLRSLALERVREGRMVKNWMRQEITLLPDNDRNDLVRSALDWLSTNEYGHVDEAILNGATESLVDSLVQEGLALSLQLWSDQRVDRATQLRFRAIENVLAGVPATLLIQAVLRHIDSCNYDQVAWITEVLDKRSPTDDCHKEGNRPPWQPSTKDLDLLIEATRQKRDAREVSNCQLEANLASLASKTDPERYLEYVLEGARRHMQAFNAFEGALQTWIAQGRRSARPMNPSYVIWFVQALRRCGFNAIQRLLEMANEPGARHIVPEALAAIVTDPWEELRDKNLPFHDNYLKDHENRRISGRVFRQPNDSYQAVTDSVALFLADRIKAMTTPGSAEYVDDAVKPSTQSHSFWETGKLLARVPSPAAMPILSDILLREDAQIFPYLQIAGGVIAQGGTLPFGSLKALKSIWQRETAKGWMEDSRRYALSGLAVLHFFVELPKAGLVQLRELLPEWLKITARGEIVEKVSRVHTEEALALLVELLSQLDSDHDRVDRIIEAICSNPMPESANVLLQLLETGGLSKYSKDMFRFEHWVAPRLTQAALSDTKFIQRLLTVLASNTDASMEAMTCAILHDIDDPRARALICRYLNEEAYPQGGRSAARVLRGQFTRETQSEPGASWYDVQPQANAALRWELYVLASQPGPSRNRSRALLLSLEENRMEMGRPVAEHRHPAIEAGTSWPGCLYLE
jgi:hypothetical protein